MTHFDLAGAAIEGALAAGARYADARIMHRRSESMQARNAEIEELSQDEDAGIGVRALVGSGWGFYAVPDMSDTGARKAGALAAAIATASASVPGPSAELIGGAPAVGSWASKCDIDPLSVTLTDKADMLIEATATMRAHGADQAEGAYRIWDTRKWFASSEGHRIDQHVRECGAAITATVIGDGETQRRSYGHDYATRGWEFVTALDLRGHAAQVAEEARALLTAPLCPAGQTDLILGSEQLALQIHESVGHAIELDRILGWEAAFAGTSWLDLNRLGSLRYGSELMNIVIDPTIPGGLGSFGYDDEGTPATRRHAVREGIWVGVLAGRDSAAVAARRFPDHAARLDYGGSVRADGWARLPMVRMTNVGLEPGPHTLDEIIAATDDGVFMETNRSWSIDDKRLNFQFGCEIGWEIKNGKKGRMLRNPTYTGIGPIFWRSMDMLGSEITTVGTPNCGKGQPGQIGHTGHPTAPARFRDVRVGVKA
jgi:TldD protein